MFVSIFHIFDVLEVCTVLYTLLFIYLFIVLFFTHCFLRTENRSTCICRGVVRL